MKNYHGEVLMVLLSTLELFGPMTYTRAALQAGVTRDNARRTLNRLAAERPAVRRVHICGWVDEFANERAYPRPVFKFGSGANKKRPPKKPRAQIVRDYMRRTQIAAGVNAFGPLMSQKKARRVMAEKRRGAA